MGEQIKLKFRRKYKSVDMWIQQGIEFKSKIYTISREQLEEIFVSITELRRLLDNDNGTSK